MLVRACFSLVRCTLSATRPRPAVQIITARGSLGSPGTLRHGTNRLLISTACFDHRFILQEPERLSEFSHALIIGLEDKLQRQADAWVVQLSYYHNRRKADVDTFCLGLDRLLNGKATQWNLEDRTPERKSLASFRRPENARREEQLRFLELHSRQPRQHTVMWIMLWIGQVAACTIIWNVSDAK